MVNPLCSKDETITTDRPALDANTYLINPYCRALFLRKGRPLLMTTVSLAATGRQTLNPNANRGSMLMKLSIASPPSKPIAASVAKVSSQLQLPSPACRDRTRRDGYI